ncbi:hypothetical protein CRENPOLYSF1_170033 [Crenothrix polyspora]|uniref:Uncharacterized protein n=1 Tax=Crenothrix polyspora TaxID=360316 RepID=A0A1R4H3Y8_9GAMM|nr:hypothetical protein CRENPOLYSF1_170033 [Crenothrix polyspora]
MPGGGLVAAQRKALYDKFYKRMDVDLDGGRRVGGDPEERGKIQNKIAKSA